MPLNFQIGKNLLKTYANIFALVKMFLHCIELIQKKLLGIIEFKYNPEKFVFKISVLREINGPLWDNPVLSSSLYLSISQSLNLSLSLRDRDRADTIITFHHPPPKTF